MKKILSVIFILALIGCSNQSNQSKEQGSEEANTSAAVDLERSEVKAEPVATYNKALNDKLNKWHFNVSLKETKQRFDYLLEMQYQEVTGEDTIHFPNFGIEPKPEIRKGNSDLECIIGFLDKKDQFREYIKVFIEDEQLRMKTLKQYAVYEK